MIGMVNSANLAYTPLSQRVHVSSVPDEKQLPFQSSQPVPYSNSIVNNNTSRQTSANTAGATNEDTVATEEQTVQQQAQVQQVINQLKARDAEVKAHEMAHLSAAGAYSTGGMSFTYQKGPDGRQYAIGGEVGIDASPVAGDPEATLQKAMVIQRAALAPAEPSSQDRKVASAATQMMAQARAEIIVQSQEESKLETSSSEEASDKRLGESVGIAAKAPEFSGIISEMQNSLQSQNGFSSSIAGNVERNQFDLRMQFSDSNLIPRPTLK